VILHGPPGCGALAWLALRNTVTRLARTIESPLNVGACTVDPILRMSLSGDDIVVEESNLGETPGSE